MKYTPSGLPILSKNIVRILKRDLQRGEKESGLDYLLKLCKRPFLEDPNFHCYILFLSTYFEKPRLANMCEGSIEMYELMRRQSESNILESDKKPNTSESGLPLLSREVISTFIRDLTTKTGTREETKDYLYNFSDRIREEDPIAALVFRASRRFSETTLPRRLYKTLGAQWIYELLRRQAETNQLEESFSQETK